MKNLARRKFVEGKYPNNIIYTIEKMSRSEYTMPQNITRDICDGIEYAISCLTQREKDIIRGRYVERKSFDDIGNIYGITGNRISQIDRKTMCKLSSPPLVGYLVYGKVGFENRLCVCKPKKMEILLEEVLNKSITELWVSINIKRLLFRFGYKTIRDIIQEGEVSEIDKNSYEKILQCIQVLMALYLPKDIICKKSDANDSND